MSSDHVINPSGNGLTDSQRLDRLERSVYRLQVVGELQGEAYLEKLIDSKIEKKLKEYDEREESTGRASVGLKISYISIAIAILMFIITLIGLVANQGGGAPLS